MRCAHVSRTRRTTLYDQAGCNVDDVGGVHGVEDVEGEMR